MSQKDYQPENNIDGVELFNTKYEQFNALPASYKTIVNNIIIILSSRKNVNVLFPDFGAFDLLMSIPFANKANRLALVNQMEFQLKNDMPPGDIEISVEVDENRFNKEHAIINISIDEVYSVELDYLFKSNYFNVSIGNSLDDTVDISNRIH